MTEIENIQEKIEIEEEINNAIIKAIEETLRFEECDFGAEVSVTIVDNEEIQRINKEQRDIDNPTDVLSFPMLFFDEDGNAEIEEFELLENGNVFLGDIVISAERAKEQSEIYGHSFKREMAFLTVHSMLHLLGYDHVDTSEGERVMIEKQEKILENIGITRD